MENINLSQANQAYIQRQKNKTEAKEKIQAQKPDKKFNKKAIFATLAILSTAAIAGIAIYKGKVSKAGSEVNNLLNNNPEIKENAAKLLKDINFNKGEAIFKETGEKFSGIIEDILGNGDKITLEYKDGILQKSARKGSIDIEKIYEKIDDRKKLTKIINGKEQAPVILKDLSEEIKKSEEKLMDILKNKENFTADELNEEINKIQYVSTKQRIEVENIIKEKNKSSLENAQKIKNEAKAQLDKTKQEAQKQKVEQLRQKWENAKETARSTHSLEDSINSYECAIEYKKLKIEQLRQQGSPLSEIEIEELEKSLGFDENFLKLDKEKLIQRNKHIKILENLKQKFNNDDEKLKNAYNDVILGKDKNISKEEFKALKELYAEKFETYPNFKIKNSQIESHHDVNGVNHKVRRAVKNNHLNDETLQNLDKQFAKLTPLEKDITVYRGRGEFFTEKGIDFDLMDKAQINDIITPDTGYSYTAVNRSLAERYASSTDGKNMIYEIRIPKGAKVSRNREHGGEVLMPRGASYKVIGKGIDADNRINVILEYILPENN